MSFTAEFWVAVGFLCFVGVLIYAGAHTHLGAAIDARTNRIRHDLAEAKRLREEAEALLVTYQRKAKEAEAEAAAILEHAKAEAEMLAKETEQRMADFIARRSKQAEQKIAMAEAQAAADVRAAAADAAVAAARIILQGEVKGPAGGEILNREIDEIKKRLH